MSYFIIQDDRSFSAYVYSRPCQMCCMCFNRAHAQRFATRKDADRWIKKRTRWLVAQRGSHRFDYVIEEVS